MGVIIPGDFTMGHIKRDFALNVFVLMRFHCNVCSNPFSILAGDIHVVLL